MSDCTAGQLALLSGANDFVRLRRLSATYLDQEDNRFTLTVSLDADEEFNVKLFPCVGDHIHLSIEDITRLPTIVASLGRLLRPQP